MDVNNTPYILLRTPDEFENLSGRLSWNATHQALMLAQDQPLRLPAADPAAALGAWAASTPLAMDTFNQLARLNPSGTQVEFNSGRGWLPLQDSELGYVSAPAGRFQDLCLGGDGRLAAPWSDGGAQHGLLLFHLARRWQTHCPLPAAPRRAWVDDDQRVWIAGTHTLMLCAGEPLPLPYTPEPERFEPVTINRHALKMVWASAQALPMGWQALALCGDAERVYLLCHDGQGRQQIWTRPRTLSDQAPWRGFALEADIPFCIDLAMAGSGRLAALAPRQAGDAEFIQRDCPVLELIWNSAANLGAARLVHERHPMLSQATPRFVSGLDGQARYQAAADPDFPQINPRPRELHALRRPQYFTQARALLQQVLDSGQPDTLWHRIFLDASIPAGCELRLSVRAYNAPEDRGAAPLIAQPAPLWVPRSSELPFGSCLADQKRAESGLFEILLQRPDGPVRRINGRHLQIEVTFSGNGRHTPALYALRVYFPRFSYQEAYLPEFFRQERAFDSTDAVGPANAADFRERFLAALEGVLTPIEGQVAAVEQLLQPQSAPEAHLPWLAELLGASLPAAWPAMRRRRLIRETGLMQQFKGTLAGINLALDIASDGGVRRGEIVVLENFRLRRTMATILGVYMDDEDHPLTLGTGMSGNSLVGDTLILSEEDARVFLSLFDPDLANQSEAQAVKAFFDRYSHQVSVLLHGHGRAVRQAVELTLGEQMPAHVQWRIIETDHPFVLGTSPLLAVDTFIETTPGFRRVALDDTYLGKEGVLNNPAAFSPGDINAQTGGS